MIKEYELAKELCVSKKTLINYRQGYNVKKPNGKIYNYKGILDENDHYKEVINNRVVTIITDLGESKIRNYIATKLQPKAKQK